MIGLSARNAVSRWALFDARPILKAAHSNDKLSTALIERVIENERSGTDEY